MESTGIFVAEATDREVILTATCYEAFVTKDNGIQLVVQISTGEWDDITKVQEIIRRVDGALDIAKGLLGIGAFIFPPAAGVLLAFAGVGTGIQIAIHILAPDERTEFLGQKVKELQIVIHNIEQNMLARFADLKLFITETEFSINITTEVAVLLKLMNNCMEYQNKEAVESFRVAYEKKSPLQLTYLMISYLEQKSTNPLVMAMEAERPVTKATFDKWENVIRSILGELRIIEGFASGLLKDGNSYDWDRLAERSEEVFKGIATWKTFYWREIHWEEMKQFLRDYIPAHTHLNNSQKANEIKAKLESYETEDVFFLCVLNNARIDGGITYHCAHENDQMIMLWDVGKCDAFIYRCRSANTTEISELEKMDGALALCRNKIYNYKQNTSHLIKDEFLNTAIVPDNNFVVVFKNFVDAQWRFTSCPKLGRNFGSSTHIELFDLSFACTLTQPSTLVTVLP